MSDVQINFAILGCGGIANHHIHHLTQISGVKAVGFQDISPAQLEKMRLRFPDAVFNTDPAAMLAAARPNLVCICTPNSTHHELSLQALAAGAHVMCEKPMAMTVKQAQEMESARTTANLLGAINFSYRCVPGFRFAREIIASGELGRIQRVNVVYLQSFLGAPDTKHSWRNDLSIAGFGTLGDLGVHMIDAVAFTTGLAATRTVGISQVLVPTKLDSAGTPKPVTTDTNASFLIEYDNGAIGTFETSQVAPGYGNHFRIEVSGTLGTVRYFSESAESLQLLAGSTLSKYSTWKSDDLPRIAVPSAFTGQQPKSNLDSFVAAIRQHTHTDYPTFADGLAAQRVLEAIGQSMLTKAWVQTI